MKATKFLLVMAVGFVGVMTAGVARAGTLVTFNGGPSLSWADGTFSTDLSGDFPDGFYALTTTSAYNGYGQNGEFISFNSPVTLDSLELIGGASGGCCEEDPTSVTVSLYNSADTLLGTLTDATMSTETLLASGQSDVSFVVFNFTGGSDDYNDGRTVAWYEVNDVTYSANATTPEPSSLLLLGTGAMGLIGVIRRKLS